MIDKAETSAIPETFTDASGVRVLDLTPTPQGEAQMCRTILLLATEYQNRKEALERLELLHRSGVLERNSWELPPTPSPAVTDCACGHAAKLHSCLHELTAEEREGKPDYHRYCECFEYEPQ